MKEDEFYWVDERGNGWEKSRFTLEQATENSKNCFSCHGCTNCSNCSNCFSCFNCSNCSNCHHCNNCRGCVFCYSCKGCKICHNCTNCHDCHSCYDCSNCHNFPSNPHRFAIRNIGGCYANTCIYWISGKTQVVCGCFVDTLEEFENAVKNKYGEPHKYLDYIDITKKIIKTFN